MRRHLGIFSKNEVGNRYGKLLVVERAPNFISAYKGEKRVQAGWKCRCDCGNTVIIRGRGLRSGQSTTCGCSKILPKGDAAFNGIYARMIQSAKGRGYKWELNKEYVKQLTSKPCNYCGIPPYQKAGRYTDNGIYLYNGLDRVNNEIGYIKSNVVPCCGRCNDAKNTMNIKDFNKFIISIYNHWAKLHEY